MKFLQVLSRQKHVVLYKTYNTSNFCETWFKFDNLIFEHTTHNSYHEYKNYIHYAHTLFQKYKLDDGVLYSQIIN